MSPEPKPTAPPRRAKKALPKKRQRARNPQQPDLIDGYTLPVDAPARTTPSRKRAKKSPPPRQLDILDGSTIIPDGISIVIPRKLLAHMKALIRTVEAANDELQARKKATDDANAALIASVLINLDEAEQPYRKAHGTGHTQCEKWPRCSHANCIAWRNQLRRNCREALAALDESRLRISDSHRKQMAAWAQQPDEN